MHHSYTEGKQLLLNFFTISWFSSQKKFSRNYFSSIKLNQCHDTTPPKDSIFTYYSNLLLFEAFSIKLSTWFYMILSNQRKRSFIELPIYIPPLQIHICLKTFFWVGSVHILTQKKGTFICIPKNNLSTEVCMIA